MNLLQDVLKKFHKGILQQDKNKQEVMDTLDKYRASSKKVLSVGMEVGVSVFPYSVSLGAEDSLVSLMEGSSRPGLETLPSKPVHMLSFKSHY